VSAWGDSELLVQLLDRQFAFLLELRGTNKVLRISRLVSFLEGEPQIAGILDDLRYEAAAALARFDEADREVRRVLAQIWATHAEAIRARLQGGDDRLQDYCPIGQFEERLAHEVQPWFPVADDTPADRTRKLLRAIQHWWKSCAQKAEALHEALPDDLQQVGGLLGRLDATYDFVARRLREESRSLPWPAYARVAETSSVTNPVPPNLSDSSGWEMHRVFSDRAKELRDADAFLQAREETGVVRIDGLYDSIDADAKILHEELRLRIGLARSRLALVQRYAARCEAFDAVRLRQACEADSGNAERLLTVDLARYLFDAGLPPLIDATVGGLRPDILHVEPASLFYVEAKQYGEDHPASQLRKAYAQVWGTWGRLRKTYPGKEAFLVVFRRAGPWAELPPVLHHRGLKLYSVVADISTQAGSREKHPVVTLTDEELLPREQES